MESVKPGSSKPLFSQKASYFPQMWFHQPDFPLLHGAPHSMWQGHCWNFWSFPPFPILYTAGSGWYFQPLSCESVGNSCTQHQTLPSVCICSATSLWGQEDFQGLQSWSQKEEHPSWPGPMMRAIFLSGLTIEKMRAGELTQPLKLGSQPKKCKRWRKLLLCGFHKLLFYNVIRRRVFTKFWEVKDGDMSPVSPKGEHGLADRIPGDASRDWEAVGEPEQGVPGLHLLRTANCRGLSLSHGKLQAGSIQLGF